MAEPTLTDIQDYKGDAAIAGGSAGAGGDAPAPVSPPLVDGLQYLQQASMARAGYNKYLADQYQQNLTTGLNDLNNLDISKALPSDLPDLRQKFADLAKQYSDNMDVVKNPASNPALWSQLQQQENELRGEIQQSTAHNVIATNNKDFLQKNPSWVTPENQAMVTNFENTPMNQRKDFLLKAPIDFDITKLAAPANAAAMSTVKSQALSKNKNWINTTEAQKVNADAYNNAILALAKNTSANGTTLYQKYLDNYNLLPADQKEDANGNPLTPDQYILAQAAPLMNKGTSTSTFTANPFALEGQTQAAENARLSQEEEFTKGQNALNRAAAADKKGELDVDVAGDAKMRNLAAAYHTGQIPPEVAQNLFGNNTLMEKKVELGGKPSATNPTGQKTTNTVKVPTTQIVRSNLTPDGTFHIVLRDNATGKLLPTQDVTPEQLYNKMDGILGLGNTAKVAEGSSKFVQKYFKGTFPSSKQLQEHYGLPYMIPTPVNSNDGTPAPAATPRATPAIPNANMPAKSLSDADYQALKDRLLKNN